MPKVTIVIPAHNAMQYLKQTLDSALRQTFGDFEVLIIDDGSQDHIADWVTTVEDKRVSLISQKNQGPSGARNTGIRHAKGEYIAFLDADDLWATTKLEKQVDYLDRRAEVGLVSTKVKLIDSDTQLIRELEQPYREEIMLETLLESNCILCGSTALVRKACFEQVGLFDLALTSFEDWDMWIRIARHYSIAALMEPLVYYRQHSMSLSKNTLAMVKNSEHLLDKVKTELPARYAQILAIAHADYVLKAAWGMLERSAYRTSLHLLIKSFSYNRSLLLSRSWLTLLSLISIKSIKSIRFQNYSVI